jgi:nucleoid DNA-binding protein
MGKAELTAIVKKVISGTNSDAELWMASLYRVVEASLKEHGACKIPNFGEFTLVHKPSRQAKNPRTGEIVATEPKSVIKFKPAAALRDLVKPMGA